MKISILLNNPMYIYIYIHIIDINISSIQRSPIAAVIENSRQAERARPGAKMEGLNDSFTWKYMLFIVSYIYTYIHIKKKKKHVFSLESWYHRNVVKFTQDWDLGHGFEWWIHPFLISPVIWGSSPLSPEELAKNVDEKVVGYLQNCDNVGVITCFLIYCFGLFSSNQIHAMWTRDVNHMHVWGHWSWMAKGESSLFLFQWDMGSQVMKLP